MGEILIQTDNYQLGQMSIVPVDASTKNTITTSVTNVRGDHSKTISRARIQ